jgi:hypothetical protein
VLRVPVSFLLPIPSGAVPSGFAVVGFDRERWIQEGEKLGERERDGASLMWDIGDWWNRGKANRVDLVNAAGWTGPTHGTCRVAGHVAERWPVLRRINTLSFDHHRIVAALSDDQATALLQWCLQAEPPRSTRELKARRKQIARAARESDLAERIEAVSYALGIQVYGDSVRHCVHPSGFLPRIRPNGRVCPLPAAGALARSSRARMSAGFGQPAEEGPPPKRWPECAYDHTGNAPESCSSARRDSRRIIPPLRHPGSAERRSPH